jgi:hypothetical protein
MNEIVKVEGQQLARPSDVMPVRDLLEMQAKIKQVMDEVMKEGSHYGNIPGCPKPSLYQPGAEKLLETFRLAARHEVHDLTTPGIIRYRVRCEITSIITGSVLGDEWGECSSDEEKYAWKGAVCHEEWEETPVDQRRKKWQKDRSGKAYSKEQIRTNPSDSANTILAMACKRAKVRAARAALAASDIFDVNIEDIPADIREEIYRDDKSATDKSKRSEALNRRQTPGATRQTSRNTNNQSVSLRDVVRRLEEIGWKQSDSWDVDEEFWHLTGKLSLPKKWKEWTGDQCAAVLKALDDINVSTSTPVQEQPELPDEITDPFADQ